MKEIVAVHYPGIKEEVLRAAMDTFFALRDAPGLKKKPSTSEFLDWLRLLVNEAVSAKDISSTAGALPRMAGALLKNEQRTEERRDGKECVRTCRSRGAPHQ